MINKEAELEIAKKTVKHLQEKIGQEKSTTKNTIARYEQPGQTDQFVRQKLLAHFHERIDQLDQLLPSPFFFRGDITHDNGKLQTVYFAKFPLITEGVFSWTSPAARIRFAELGEVTYSIPDQGSWTGTLTRKDQCMITQGEIRFMTSETKEDGRTLIYQEQLSKRKTDFMLPEIVARMEKAQDDVIRAHAYGSFLISGPAGSGKTTLAFHRIAYLLQSPEHATQFSDETVIVFVQDENTQAYFSKLLPELGIHNVCVTTFFTWACKHLNIHNSQPIRRQNGTDNTIDAYEQKKLEALKQTQIKNGRNSFALLKEIYSPFFSDEDHNRLEEQQEKNLLDRFDITLLCKNHLIKEGHFTKNEEYFERKKGFEVVRKQRKMPEKYSLMVIDEVQNYLPEQIEIMRSCIAKETNAMLYVGDLRQKILFGTLSAWSDVGEFFLPERKVTLEKVYRSTKNILTYIRSIGYEVDIPDEMREGEKVQEIRINNIHDEIAHIQNIITHDDNNLQTGILGFSGEYLQSFCEAFRHRENVHVMTTQQSQGVEFDRVIIVGLHENVFTKKHEGHKYADERAKIQKDLLYVALTRAIDEMYLFTSESVQALTAHLFAEKE